jgi:hypothetical protein
MRKLLVLSFLGIAAGAAGCTRGPCGETWRPGYYLFGAGRQNNQGYQQQGPCCDPCGGSGGGMISGGEMMMSPGPMMQQAPCCQ